MVLGCILVFSLWRLHVPEHVCTDFFDVGVVIWVLVFRCVFILFYK